MLRRDRQEAFVIQGSALLPHGMLVRPARPGDRDFLAALYRESRGDLRRAHADPDYVEMTIEIQLRAQTSGYGSAFPNALYLVIERLASRIGCLTLDIGAVEMRLVNLEFIGKLRGSEHRSGVLLWLMRAATQARRPLIVPCRRDHAPLARFLQRHGFQPDPSISDDLYWRMVRLPSYEDSASSRSTAVTTNGKRAP